MNQSVALSMGQDVGQGIAMGEAAGSMAFLARAGQPRLAYRRTAGRGPGVIFLGGFGSDMTGTKATALEAAAVARGRAFLRFDYRGHGRSEGNFVDSTLGDWLNDAQAIFDAATDGPQILVGSSMGGCIALLLALARPARVAAVVGVAAAPDFTERLMWQGMSEADRVTLARDGVLYPPSAYGDPIPITRALIEEGRRHLLLDRPIRFAGPVRLLQGQRDPDVPWQHSLLVAERLSGDDVRIVLVKDGDHRLSRPQDIALLIRTVDEVASALEA
jgi:pimeloyl-ACP methyl ester carboxylesterase